MKVIVWVNLCAVMAGFSSFGCFACFVCFVRVVLLLSFYSYSRHYFVRRDRQFYVFPAKSETYVSNSTVSATIGIDQISHVEGTEKFPCILLRLVRSGLIWYHLRSSKGQGRFPAFFELLCFSFGVVVGAVLFFFVCVGLWKHVFASPVKIFFSDNADRRILKGGLKTVCGKQPWSVNNASNSFRSSFIQYLSAGSGQDINEPYITEKQYWKFWLQEVVSPKFSFLAMFHLRQVLFFVD